MTDDARRELRAWLQFSLSIVGALLIVGAAWASLKAQLAVIETKLEHIPTLTQKIDSLDTRLRDVEKQLTQERKPYP